jgi:hypothetical protein
MKKIRLVIGMVLLSLGFTFWLLIGPFIINLSGEMGSFFSLLSWVGLSISIIGVVLVFYSIGRIIG